MTDSGKQRPRRAFSVDDSQPDGVDDTRSGYAGRARRGAADDIDSPFTRPDPPSRETVVPAPVLPGTERRAAPGSGVGRRGMRWNGLNDETTPAERDSVAPGLEPPVHAAVSPTPPPRTVSQHQVQSVPSWSGWPDQQPPQPAREPNHTRMAAHRSPARAADPEPEPEAGNPWREEGSRGEEPDRPVASTGWFSHHRRTITTWVVAAVAAAVLIAGGVYVFSHMANQTPAANPSTSEANGEPADLTDTSLLDTSDVASIDAAADWSVTQTVTEKGKDGLRKVNCLESDPAGINTTATLQRAIGTQQDDKLALVHQVDAYTNEETARKIYEQRATSLASCSAMPALITGSSTITGLGDEVLQMSVVQEETSQYHTILLVRTGKVLSLLDVARNNSAVEPQGAATALQRPLTATCETSAGTCPATPEATKAAPPAVSPQGWLIPNDIPIIAPGRLAWTATSVKEVGSSTMGCEGMTLSSEQGPTDRKQRDYVVGSADEAFKVFGITQFRFTFADEAAATAFGDLLSGNLASCAQRAATAKVTELDPLTTDGSDGPVVTARLFNVTQQLSDDGSRPYQLVVARSGTAVSYLLFTGVGDSQFTQEQLKTLAVRLGQRTAQG